MDAVVRGSGGHKIDARQIIELVYQYFEYYVELLRGWETSWTKLLDEHAENRECG